MGPELSAQLTGASVIEQATLYAANGYWHEALTTLAVARRANPTDAAIATAWRNLLQSVELGHLSTAQLLLQSSASTTAQFQ
jgi:hypothetical protein